MFTALSLPELYLQSIGPASYIVTAADLHPVHKVNQIFKFADDTYLAVPPPAQTRVKKR